MTRPTPKKDFAPRDTSAFARGGSTRMLGKGDRTTTATEDAAGRQTPGQTTTKSQDNPKFARGGKRIPGFSVSLPAQPGHCAPIHKGR
jgi:hypothetical protein